MATPALPPGYAVIKEGQASVLVPKGNKVFYNPVQEFNRDLSIVVLTQFAALKTEELQARADLWLERKRLGPQGLRNKKARELAEAASSPVVAETDGDALEIPERFKYPGLRIFEALAASGLRSIRYFKEVPNVATIHVNDLDPAAVASIQRNALFNGLPLDRFIPSQGDALGVMYANRPVSKAEKFAEKLVTTTTDGAPATAGSEPAFTNFDGTPLPPPGLRVKSLGLPPWDAIDLDPYGSVAPFVDAAIQSIDDGGLLLVTSTDSGVLCGSRVETTYGKYGALPLPTHACHEGAVRIVLGLLDTVAARYHKSITPLISFSIDFYIRVFVRVHSSPALSKLALARRGLAYACVGCKTSSVLQMGRVTPREEKDTFLTPKEAMEVPNTDVDKLRFTPAVASVPDRLCKECGCVAKVAGPLWLAPLHDPSFARRCREYVEKSHDRFRTHARLEGMLGMAESELPDTPFFYLPSMMANVLHVPTPRSAMIRAALLNAGYRYSGTHCVPAGFKTDAPASFVWDIVRAITAATSPAGELPATTALTRARMLGGCSVTLEDGVVFNAAAAAAADSADSEADAAKRAEHAAAVAAAAAAGGKMSVEDAQRLALATSDARAALRLDEDAIYAAANAEVGAAGREGRPPGVMVLAKVISAEKIDFSKPKEGGEKKIKVFFPNPEEYWGPKAAAGIFAGDKRYDDPRLATVAETGGAGAKVGDDVAEAVMGSGGSVDGENAAAAVTATIVAAQKAKMRANQGKRMLKRAADAAPAGKESPTTAAKEEDSL